jgi:hypothetical protein
VCVLLVNFRKRLKMQYFVRRVLKGWHRQPQFKMLGEFPFVLQLNTRPSRLSLRFQALDECTSDEQCLEFAQLRLDWQLISLAWTWLADGNLLSMVVLGSDEEFTPMIPHKPRSTIASQLVPDELLEDPFEVGRRAARPQPGAADEASRAAGDRGPPAPLDPGAALPPAGLADRPVVRQ